MAWRWIAPERAVKDLKKLPLDVQKRIIKKLDFWVESGTPLRFAEVLTNYELGGYRFRIGDYRVTFDVEDETIVILTAKHRKDVYR